MKNLCGDTLDKQYIKMQKKQGEKVMQFTLCPDIIFHQYFFSQKYIKYECLERMFLRIEDGDYGDFSVHEYSIVLIDKAGVEHVLHVEGEAYGREILNRMEVSHPEIKIGKQ